MASSATIRTGLIGFGLSGRIFHEPFLSTNPAFTLEVISAGDPNRQAQAREHAEVVSTPEELLSRDLDLVVLASPAHAHLKQGIAALEAGAAVVIDKPFAASVADAEELIAVSERVGLPLFVFQNRRWDGDFLTVRKLLATGRLGTVHRFESTFERFSSKPLQQRWQDTLTPANGAGIAFDLGSHLIDQALQLFGPATLQHAELRTIRDGGMSDDDAFLSLLHTSGVISHLTMSRVAAQAGPRFRVLGDASAYSVYGLDNQEQSLVSGARPGDEGFGVTPEAEWGVVGGEGASRVGGSASLDGSRTGGLEPVPTERGDYPAFYAGVAAAIRDGAPVPVAPRESLETVRIITQAQALMTRAKG